MLTSVGKRLFLSTLKELTGGVLELVSRDGTLIFGDGSEELRARLVVHDDRFFRHALLGGDTGLGEAYTSGEWSSPDLVALIRLAARNLQRLEDGGTSFSSLFSSLSRLTDNLRHRLATPIAGSRRNIRAHYDLSNDFFRLFLDRNMLYSCAWYETARTYQTAQRQKLDRICRKLELRSGDRVLEIGTGWGAFALHAARNYGCRVTTTTISQQQYDYARAWFDAADPDHRIQLLREDYRELRGRFDKIVSIEMFEAVGFDHYDEFFGACDQLLESDGAMLLQTITIDERKFPRYRKRSDWIQKHIFPGRPTGLAAGHTGLARARNAPLAVSRRRHGRALCPNAGGVARALPARA